MPGRFCALAQILILRRAMKPQKREQFGTKYVTIQRSFDHFPRGGTSQLAKLYLHGESLLFARQIKLELGYMLTV
jgi:hypothetical protein